MTTRKITEMLDGGDSAGPPAPTGIVGPDRDGAIPGEVVLALETAAAARIVASIPSAPLRSGTVHITAFGADDLDGIIASLDVVSIARVHGPSPAIVADGVATASDLGLDGVFRIRYAASESPADAAARLATDAAVAWAEPNYWRETSKVPNDPQFGSQWGLTRINAPAAWDYTTGDPSVVVAVVDTGVDLNHPDLAPLLVPGRDLVDWPVGTVPQPGWVLEGDYTGADTDPQDEVGHGTHVAGTICALSDNNVGVAGVNWNARLMPVRVLARTRNPVTNEVRGSGTSANIAAGIRWAADNGARVVNLSLGGYQDAIVEREAVAYAVSRGVVVVAAMGNDNTATPSYPAAYPDVVAVAATDSTDRRAWFSNTGPHIDISGPGVGVVSTYWDDTYNTLSGTSMATPHVAGVAALVLARDPNLSAAQVAAILRNTAKPLRDNPADPVPNDSYGAGLVQADAAVAAAGPPVKSLQVICVSKPLVICQKSLFTLCESTQIICQKSVHTLCISTPVVCPKSTVVLCRSVPVLCQKSELTCPSVQAGCQSVALCPSVVCPSLACRSAACNPGGPPEGGAADWSAYDPYEYDPYGSDS